MKHVINNVINIVIAARPHQWIKNLVIFAAIIFVGEMFSLPLLIKTIFAFFLFCLLTGSNYIINDIIDAEKDKLHPYKKYRLIASGKLDKKVATCAAIILAIIGLSGSLFLNKNFAIVATIYYFLILAYSIVLKNIVILDVIVLAHGFVLRAIAGAVVIAVEFSNWLVICTLLLAMFLGLAKRRHELLSLSQEIAPQHRYVLKDYSTVLIDGLIAATSGSIIIAYSLYAFLSEVGIENKLLPFTIPFVIYGIFRYSYLIYHTQKGGRPEKDLFTDKAMLICILCWIIAVIMIIYI